MDLTTFGNIIRQALELEAELGRLAATAPTLGLAAPQAELLATLGVAASKTIKTLERARQENIVEAVLEPIKDLRSEDFDFARPGTLDAATVGPYVVTLLTTLHRFYTQAGAKLAMHDCRRVLGRFAQERESFLGNASSVFPQP